MRHPALRAAALLLGAACSLTAYGTTFAVVPLVGRHLTMVGAQPVTSTRLDRNQYQVVPIEDETFDVVARAAVERVVRARHADDVTLLVRVSVPVDDKGEVPVDKVISAVMPRAVEASARYLVVIVPHRATPMLADVDGHMGTGSASGIGMYVNRYQKTHIVGGEGEYGFLGLFANFRVMVVDATTGATRGEALATVGRMYSAARAKDRDPMNALSTAEKLGGLQGLLRDEIVRVLPGLLDQAGL
jgi:hypothetical protein